MATDPMNGQPTVREIAAQFCPDCKEGIPIAPPGSINAGRHWPKGQYASKCWAEEFERAMRHYGEVMRLECNDNAARGYPALDACTAEMKATQRLVELLKAEAKR